VLVLAADNMVLVPGRVYLVPQEELEQAPGLVDSVLEREQEQVCLVQAPALVQEQGEENMVPDPKNKALVLVQEPANMVSAPMTKAGSSLPAKVGYKSPQVK
jgi:hypothetical protein